QGKLKRGVAGCVEFEHLPALGQVELGLALTLGVTDRVEGGGAMLDLVSQNLPRLPAKLADGLCRRGGRENECRKICQQKTADHGSPPSVIRAARMRRLYSK